MRLVIRDLKVRHKLLLPAAVAIAALALTTGLALRSARQGDALLRQVEEHQAPALELWRDVEGLLAAVQRSFQDAVDAEDAAPLEEADRLHAELLARLDAAAHVAGERAAAVRAEVAAYHALARPVTVRLVGGAKAQEVMGDVSALTARFAALRATIGEETVRARAEMRAAFGEARALQLRSATTTGVAALAAILAALGLATWIASGVSRPLEALEATALRIAQEGDLTAAVRAEGRDEVGRVAESFRRMVERLRAVLLTLRAASEDLSGASSALGALTRDQTELLSRQASGVAETSATTRELEQTSAVASQRAEEVLAVARRGGERSDAGLAAVGRSLERIEGIRDGVGRILSRVQDLGARARLVGEIGGTVEDLALQSHVLSINASLEAVRAGEAGKGFAVVAEQVRALASASRASAGRIAGTVRDIVAALDETDALSREGGRTMADGLAEVRASGESLREIGGVVRDTSAAALQIAAAVQQQGTGVRQIAQAMADIDGGMEVTVERLRKLEGEARRLATTSDRISAVVREFKL